MAIGKTAVLWRAFAESGASGVRLTDVAFFNAA
jgi:hypothetical protein